MQNENKNGIFTLFTIKKHRKCIFTEYFFFTKYSPRYLQKSQHQQPIWSSITWVGGGSLDVCDCLRIARNTNSLGHYSDAHILLFWLLVSNLTHWCTSVDKIYSPLCTSAWIDTGTHRLMTLRTWPHRCVNLTHRCAPVCEFYISVSTGAPNLRSGAYLHNT